MTEYCQRCRREAPASDGYDYLGWEATDDGEGIICPGCLTLGEETAIEADNTAVLETLTGDTDVRHADLISTPHAPKLDVVARKIDEALNGHFIDDLDDTDAVVDAVVRALSSRLYSDRSRELTRGSVLLELQRRDVEAGRDPAVRLTREGDDRLIDDSLRNAEFHLHDEWESDWPDGRP